MTRSLKPSLKHESSRDLIEDVKHKIDDITTLGAIGTVVGFAGFDLMFCTATFNGTTQYLPDIFGGVTFVGLIMLLVYTQLSKRLRKTNAFKTYRKQKVDWQFLGLDVAVVCISVAELVWLFYSF